MGYYFSSISGESLPLMERLYSSVRNFRSLKYRLPVLFFNDIQRLNYGVWEIRHGTWETDGFCGFCGFCLAGCSSFFFSFRSPSPSHPHSLYHCHFSRFPSVVCIRTPLLSSAYGYSMHSLRIRGSTIHTKCIPRRQY
ncbi:hypothetical protein CI102_4614 [Trichoderma harzianum]|uniref:Uncharacterized protein n=1 Tax=Trichoderma harzianum CBS 226.95 TaxID=983964 RepID=A0A2T4AFD1_TRIHA|nr:hypothetical protein M431DRAFT_407402 [Trichoderma harzianum CBS 226.95]PKK51065.1 hypothetical protein CI102_4614 [Trichoderma harzianum]PTB55712.1 hypothetical protein M431DRAFT_407402 [Trichoderma harzianum CBS 226.95]